MRLCHAIALCFKSIVLFYIDFQPTMRINLVAVGGNTKSFSTYQSCSLFLTKLTISLDSVEIYPGTIGICKS